ncbi:plastidial pyruvate kinase 4, chloroplastic [Olea europaea subsp. europaea]|uniref:Pyruvate kinase n=1 Tax=Olea europaea subsp. europaea TaxID=158383 RepID=A0A8S0U765_OLEEU|nr:plastidial pyruvate kinase 4, chloroplastic [Olea europaea subsp. europaea]
MKSPNQLGVRIARGDLAVECGWEKLADIQEEIISICNVAHVPVIWATQVLESLVKSGVPTRAEITDAANGRSFSFDENKCCQIRVGFAVKPISVNACNQTVSDFTV